VKHHVRDIISCGIVMDESDLIMHAHHLCFFLSICLCFCIMSRVLTCQVFLSEILYMYFAHTGTDGKVKNAIGCTVDANCNS
jgi:hypothetical protein